MGLVLCVVNMSGSMSTDTAPEISPVLRGEVIQVVTQRVSSFKLLVSEESDEWIESDHSGLVLYVSFVSTGPEVADGGPIDNLRMAKAVKSLMNAKLATTSGWKTDHSDAVSLSSLAVTASEQIVNIVVVPQATLTGRLIPGDKYLKYHRQLGREWGFDLYTKFVKAIADFFKCKSDTISTSSGSSAMIGERVSLTWGSYGKRQGFEMVSSGPSTHYFEF